MQLGISLALVRLKNGTGAGGAGASPPVNTSPPVISGSAPYYVGSTLNRTQGTYTGSPTLVSTYQISIDNGSSWTDMATTASYIIQNADQGTTLQPQARIKEVATNGGGSITTYSNVLNLFNPVVNIANGTMWLDAADTQTIVNTSGQVSQWNDKSANGNSPSQLTSSAQPITGARTINGLNAIDFSGSSQRLSNLPALNDFGNTDNTIFLIFVPDSLGDRRIVVCENGTPRYMVRAGTTRLEVVNSATVTTFMPVGGTLTIGQTFIGGYTFNTSNSPAILGYTNGSSNSVAGSATGILGGCIIGSFSNGNFAYDGALGEVLFYRRSLSTAELNAVGNYLSTKWAGNWTNI